MPDTLREIIDNWLGKHEFTLAPDRPSLRHAADNSVEHLISQLKYSIQHGRRRVSRDEVIARLAPERASIEAALLKAFPSAVIQVSDDPVRLRSATYAAANFLGGMTHYLGPLRDEPKAIYPLELPSDVGNVGYRGEHTAAVFDLFKDRKVWYVPTPYSGGAPSELKQATLHDAAVDWIRYLSIADDVSTVDRGKFGHQLTVASSSSGKFHDLTNVGVGVSQVLPIVVMSLLAEPQSSLIFEQPELHLHPKVQTRLADFFLSLLPLKKQCLIETHSEYSVHRIRRRMVENNISDPSEMVRIFFVEHKLGETKCRPLTISPFGAIVDWLEDFFDQSQHETQSIVLAAAAKRRREKK